ncbi:MAG: hypothetical protein H6713_42565, partial [Myxococcales bacterium]|nr:hypothetical protein [Myxococcales bacterium]
EVDEVDEVDELEELEDLDEVDAVDAVVAVDAVDAAPEQTSTPEPPSERADTSAAPAPEPAPDAPRDRPRWSTTGSVGPAMIVSALALVALYAVPALEFARPWKPGDPAPFWNLVGRPFERANVEAQEHVAEVDSLAAEVLAADDPPPPVTAADPPVRELDPGDALPAYVPREGDDKPAVQPLELFTGDELDNFYAALARTDGSLKDAVTRVVHWGDSAIGIDGIPGAIRRRMQTRFGDSGHGFHVISQPNTSYRHREVEFKENKKWGNCFIIFKCRDDGHYGLGGVTSRSKGGAQSSFAPHKTRSSGRVSRFELWYAAQPGGGDLRVRVDRGEREVIETAADALEDRWYRVDVEDGYHELEVRAAGGGAVRVYGVTLERDVPGVVWDSLALVGAFTKRLGELDEDHLRVQLERRQPNLAVFTFGGNDMIRRVTMEDYADEYRAVVQKFRRARPEMDCIVMAPLDHGERKGARIVSRPVVPLMVEAQREVAKSMGCAFFDTLAAMGGPGSAGRWYKRKPKLIGGDLSHATSKGHQVIGELVYRALLQEYVAYRRRTDGAPRAVTAAPDRASDRDDPEDSNATADAVVEDAVDDDAVVDDAADDDVADDDAADDDAGGGAVDDGEVDREVDGEVDREVDPDEDPADDGDTPEPEPRTAEG